jgi:hypothetical protein
MDGIRVTADEPLQRGEGRQWNVPIQHQHPTVLTDVGQGLEHGVAGSQLWLLERKRESGGGKGRSHFLAAVSIDEAYVAGAQGPGSVYHVLSEVPTAQPMKDFRPPRMHPPALACGKDYHVKRH